MVSQKLDETPFTGRSRMRTIAFILLLAAASSAYARDPCIRKCVHTGSHLGERGYPVPPGTTSTVTATGQPHQIVPWMGNSIATVAQQMPKVILYEARVQPANTAAQMVAMGPYMFANLTNDYIRNGGDVMAFLEAVATQATPSQLLYIRSGFGAATDIAVSTSAPVSVKEDYQASAPLAAIPTSHAALYDAGLVSLLTGFLDPQFTMTQNELWWDFFLQSRATTVAQATFRMAYFEGKYLLAAFTFGYWAGGHIATFLDKVNPNINIQIGNMIGVTVDWTITLIQQTPTGTGYIDLPVDANGDFIFPVLDTTWDDTTWDWEDCGC